MHTITLAQNQTSQLQIRDVRCEAAARGVRFNDSEGTHLQSELQPPAIGATRGNWEALDHAGSAAELPLAAGWGSG
jgi:hypothetical protein